MLQAIGLTQDEATDPAILFVFRNLDLLVEGGVLVIVLPDGLLQSKEFAESLRVYERCRNTQIQVVGIVSLPAVTFSLGGTVAKTSFVLFKRSQGHKPAPVYLAHAHHVGFIKRSNRRAADPNGNELLPIAREFASHKEAIGHFGRDWHEADRLTFGELRTAGKITDSDVSRIQLNRLVSSVRESTKVVAIDGANTFHVSILDVDDTGLINVVAAAKNRPVTTALKCRPGDILVSCINPRIWRTTIIPEIDAIWSCSAEFVVLRPKEKKLAWAISLALHHQCVIAAVENLSGGTSSSRQRVEKSRILELAVPKPEEYTVTAKQHCDDRNHLYAIRLRDMRLYSALHSSAKPVY